MLKNGIVFLTLIFTFIYISTASAKEKKPSGPPEVQKTVDAFAGKWGVQMALTMPGKEPVKFKAVLNCKKIAAGTAVDCSFSTHIPGIGLMEETDLWGYDSEAKALHDITWNNLGEIHDHRCQWKDDQTIECAHTATSAGGPIEEKEVVTFTGAKKMMFEFTSKSAEGVTVFTGDATRR